MSYTYAVITGVAAPETGGNMAMASDLMDGLCYVREPADDSNGYNATLARVDVDRLLEAIGPVTFRNGSGRATTARLLRPWDLQQPVFHVGEILILDESGREVGYPGRKPSKWVVDVADYDNLAEAVQRSREVRAFEVDRIVAELPEGGPQR